jgi:hypothetical protein
MLNIISSTASNPSPVFIESPRQAGEDNLRWLGRHPPSGNQQTTLLLVGGRSPTAFRLRVAQSHLRHDLTPSHWSHIMLLGESARSTGRTAVYEISLEPAAGFGFPPPSNAVQRRELEAYRSPRAYPNIALLRIPISPSEVMRALDRFQRQRAVVDALELLLRWLAFAWGVGRAGNPLLDGQGLPSAAMLETVLAAVGFDLTPGLESRASCPEAIWQASKWWHEYYIRENRQAPSGAYYVGHKL